jgi:predicted DNA binding protein
MKKKLWGDTYKRFQQFLCIFSIDYLLIFWKEGNITNVIKKAARVERQPFKIYSSYGGGTVVSILDFSTATKPRQGQSKTGFKNKCSI